MKNFCRNNNNNLINNNKDNNNYIYELAFNAITNISNSSKSNEVKNKIVRMIIKIFENIIKAEIKKENSQSFRKIQITNPNISLIFDTKGNYEFFKSLGFNEKYFGEELCLYLSSKNINIPLFLKLISFIELLTINFQENDNKTNYYELENNKQNNFININFNNQMQFWNNPNNININCINMNFNNKKNNNNNFLFNIHNFNNHFINNNINNFPKINNNVKNGDEIGKKCFHLTNNFRAKNNLPPLLWDDSIWRISFTHSKNMGESIVPFGHKGFNERVNQFPFFYTLACENVFMCKGFINYDIATLAVNGWINSPGHRKNLLSNSTHCAIATYINNSGAFYLTQMFARKK